MNVSTNSLFSQAVTQMGDLQTRISKIQTQISTGQMITRPSDDPNKLNAIQRLQSAINRQEGYARTLGTVTDRLSAAETSIKSANDIMARLKELAMQAANDTAGSADRINIATEMSSLRDQLQTLAAAKDTDGSYLFSGTRSAVAPFTTSNDGSISYTGDQTATQVQVGDQFSITANRPGDEVFTGVTRTGTVGSTKVGFFQAINELIDGVRASNGAVMSRGLGEVDQLSAGLTQALAQNGADQSALNAQKTLIDETQLRLKTTLSNLQDTDYTEAITRLQKESTGLQAAQSSFAKISNLSLFNFIR